MTRAIVGLLALALVFFVAGCVPRPMRSGELHLIRFGVRSVDAPWGVRDTVSLAEGAKATLATDSVGRGPVTSVVSGNPSVLGVDLDARGFVHLLALAAGDSRMWVEIGALRDVIEVRVRPVTSVDVTTAIVRDGTPVAALIGRHARFRLVAHDATDAELVATGADVVRIVPANTAHLIPILDETRTLEVAFDAPGRAKIGGELGKQALVDVLRYDDIQSLTAIEAPLTTHAHDDPGAMSRSSFVLQLSATLEPTTDGTLRPEHEMVVSDGAIAASMTPETCVTAPAAMTELDRLVGTGFVYVRGVRNGRCEVAIDFGGRSTTFVGEIERDRPSSIAPRSSVDSPVPEKMDRMALWLKERELDVLGPEIDSLLTPPSKQSDKLK